MCSLCQYLFNGSTDFKREIHCELLPTFVKLKHCPRKLTQCPAGPSLTLSVFYFFSVKCLYYVHVKIFIIWYIVLACRFDTMPKKFKKRPEISTPQNFEHRVHTGFDTEQGKYVGLPPQWAGLIIPEEKTERRRPLIDPSSITHTEIAPLKVNWFTVLSRMYTSQKNSHMSTKNLIGWTDIYCLCSLFG